LEKRSPSSPRTTISYTAVLAIEPPYGGEPPTPEVAEQLLRVGRLIVVRSAPVRGRGRRRPVVLRGDDPNLRVIEIREAEDEAVLVVEEERRP
jgi:hypothetical protein